MSATAPPIKYTAIATPSEPLLRSLAENNPENPFFTLAYVESKVQRGAKVVAFAAATGYESRPACIGFVGCGHVHRDLAVVSAPAVDAGHPLWGAVNEFCRREHITRVRIQTFGTPGGSIPVLGRKLEHYRRLEHVLTLDTDVPPPHLSSNHRRNLRKAEKAGLKLANIKGKGAISAHLLLVSRSMSRLQDRGEVSATGVSPGEVQALVDSAAATIFQATSPDGEVLSSIVVLLSGQGAYYHSAGTSPDGMSVGASQFLICAVAETLRDRGMTRFNLGGTEISQEGLVRFKQGFGAWSIPLESACYLTATGIRRLVVASADRARVILSMLNVVEFRR